MADDKRSKSRALADLTITELILLLLFMVLLASQALQKEKFELATENKKLEEKLAQLQEIEESLEEILGKEFTKAELNQFAKDLELAAENKKLEEQLAQLQEIKEEFGKELTKDEFDQLIQQFAENKKREEEFARLQEVKELQESLEEKLGKQLTKDEFSQFELISKQDLKQYKYYKMKAAGADFPPCWPRDDAVTKAEYLFDAEIKDAGIILISTDEKYPHRREDRKKLPLDHVVTDSVISLEDFLSQTKDIFEFSGTQECRHSVTIRDKTGNDKKLWKALKNAIEDRFYFYEHK